MPTRVHREQGVWRLKRRIKTQTVPPCAEIGGMLFWALMASDQIVMRKVDGWRSLAERPADQTIDLAARSDSIMRLGDASTILNTRRDGI